ncbi:hypothetical protein C8Q79DRAFT_986919, partial [Trametes meyenii]
CGLLFRSHNTQFVPFGVTYEKIGTIQRRLAWPLHKDDTLSRSGRPTGLNIYFVCCEASPSVVLYICCYYRLSRRPIDDCKEMRDP